MFPAEPSPDRPNAPSAYPFPSDAGHRLAWAHVERRLADARNYWLVTASPKGVPHATPVWGVWTDTCLYFDGHPYTRWARNLAANPRATVHLESGEDVVIISGLADDLTVDTDLADRIVSLWMAKYGRLAPEPATSGLFRLQAHNARAWTDPDLHDGTRWTLR